METKKKGSYVSGIILIILGIGYISGFSFLGHNARNIQVLLGGLFLAGYFYKDSYGLLIPGCLLLGIAFSDPLAAVFHRVHFPTLGLGVGFIAIYFIDLVNKGKTHWWPLIPGSILLIPKIFSMRMLFSIGWGVALIAFGIYIVFKPSGKNNNRKEEKVENNHE